MVQQNEIIALLLAIGVLIFAVLNRACLARVPSSTVLLASFYVLLVGRILTVAEGFFLPGVLNLLEHVCCAGSAILMAVWCGRAFRKEAGQQ